jgi:hypothetical protein
MQGVRPRNGSRGHTPEETRIGLVMEWINRDKKEKDYR